LSPGEGCWLVLPLRSHWPLLLGYTPTTNAGAYNALRIYPGTLVEVMRDMRDTAATT
jgi:hypothetical protein